MARSKSSSRWLEEHVNDPFVKQAQIDGYRSRASYKLLEINTKDKLIHPNMLVMDLGSAPGGWSQVSAKLVGLALDMARQVLKPKGSFVAKVFHGEGYDEYVKDLRTSFDKVVIRKPDSSRARSREVYVVGKGFKG